MATHSISGLILRVRRMADVVNHTNATTSAEVQQYLWNSLYELQQNVGAFSNSDNWLAVTASANTTAGTASYVISGIAAAGTEIYQIRGVDVKENDVWLPIAPSGWENRGKYLTDPTYPYLAPAVQYRISSRPGIGTTGTISMFVPRIVFVPTPSSVWQYRVHYVPAPDMSTVTSFQYVPPLWDEYAVVDAAMKVLERDQQDTQQLMARRAKLEKTILLTAQDKDLGAPGQVQDTGSMYEP